MSVQACAQIVERGDPDRFLAVMSCPVAMRDALFAIYAFNVEVARAPWVTQEPMIAEMRLQWWRDALGEIADGKAVRKHEVTDALAQVLDPEGARALDGLVAARRWDCYTEPFEDLTHFEEYINATAGDLLWTAARLAGAGQGKAQTNAPPNDLEGTIRRYGHGMGVANWFRAIPELENRGRKPLADGTPDGVRLLALGALRDLDTARWSLGKDSMLDDTVAAALRVGWRAKRTLKKAARDPLSVAEGRLEESPLRRRTGLLWHTLRGTF